MVAALLPLIEALGVQFGVSTAAAGTAAAGTAAAGTAAAGAGTAGASTAAVTGAVAAETGGTAAAAQAARAAGAGQTGAGNLKNIGDAAEVIKEAVQAATPPAAAGGGNGGNEPPSGGRAPPGAGDPPPSGPNNNGGSNPPPDDPGKKPQAPSTPQIWDQMRSMISHPVHTGATAYGYSGTTFGGYGFAQPDFSGLASAAQGPASKVGQAITSIAPELAPMVEMGLGQFKANTSAAMDTMAFGVGQLNAAGGGGWAGNQLATTGANVIDLAADAAMNPLNAPQDLFKMAVEIGKMPQLIKDWGNELVESKRGISQFNGELSATFAEQERRDILRGIDAGKATSGTTADLSESLNDLKDEIQPMLNGVSNALNRIATTAVRGVEVAYNIGEAWWDAQKYLPSLSNLAVRGAEWLGRQAASQHEPNMHQFMKGILAGDLMKGPMTPKPKGKK